MKKIFLLIGFLISAIISFGQGNPFYPSTAVHGAPYATNTLGTLYSKGDFTSGILASDFTNNNASTPTISGTQISVSAASASTDTQSVDITAYPNTALEYFHYFLRFTINSAQSGTTHGIGTSLRSSNTEIPSSIIAYVDLATGAGQAKIVNTYPAHVVVATSSNTLTYSNGDSIEYTLDRYGAFFSFTARNATTNAVPIVLNYTYNTTYAYSLITATTLPNTGHFAISTIGGTYLIDSISVTSREIIRSNAMFIGDSKTTGYYGNFSNRWASILKSTYFNSVVEAGGGDKVQQVSDRLTEIIALKPRQVLIEIGTNDTDTSAFKTTYASVVSSLQAAGISVYHTCFYQTSGSVLWRWNYLLRTYPIANIIDCYNPLKNNGAITADGLHPSNYGDTLIANAIVASGIIGGQSFSSTSLSSSGIFINNSTDQQLSTNFNIDGVGQAGYLALTPSSNTYGISKFYNASASAGDMTTYLYSTNLSGNSNSLYIMPRGGGNGANRSNIGLFNTDYVADATNFEGFFIQAKSTETDLYTTKGGTGTLRPLKLFTGSNTQLSLNIDGTNTITGLTTIATGLTFPSSGSGETVKFYNSNSIAGFGVNTLYPTSATNDAMNLYLIPRGTGQTGNKSQMVFWETDFIAGPSNGAYASITSTGSALEINTTAFGTGTIRPIILYAGANTNQLKLNTDGSTTVNGNLTLGTAGNALNITEGSNGRVGQTTLVSGTKAITITGLTTSSRAFVTLVTPSGVTLTTTYQAVCTSNTLTIQANVAAGTINTSDASVLNYFVIN